MIQGTDMYFNGKALNAVNAESTSGSTGITRDELFLTNQNNSKTGDFTGDDVTYVPDQFYWNTDLNKWFISGQYINGVDDKGNSVSSAIYDVEATEKINSLLSNPEYRQLMSYDRSRDIVNASLPGTSTVAEFGETEVDIAKYGKMIVSQTNDGNYQILGKIYDPVKGELVNISDTFLELGLDPRKLNKEQVQKALGDAFLHRNLYNAETIDNNIPFAKEYKDLNEKTSNSLDSALLTISSVESGYDDPYNMMNQGGTDGGKKAINPGNSNKILKNSLTKMTIGEVMAAQATNDPRKKLHAAGKYQIIGKTLTELVKKLNINENALFNETMQDKLALELLKGRLNKSDKIDDLIEELKNEWRGLDNLSGNDLEQFKRDILNLKSAI